MSQIKKIGTYSETGTTTGFGKYASILKTTEYRYEQRVVRTPDELKWEQQQILLRLYNGAPPRLGKLPKPVKKPPPNPNPTMETVGVPVVVARTVPPDLAKTALEDPVLWQADFGNGVLDF